MPFGLSGASSTFQQMMDLLIKDKHDFAALTLTMSVFSGETHTASQNNPRTALQCQPHC